MRVSVRMPCLRATWGSGNEKEMVFVGGEWMKCMYRWKRRFWCCNDGTGVEPWLDGLDGVGKGKRVAVGAHAAALDHDAFRGHEVGVTLNERKGRVLLDLVDYLGDVAVDLGVGAEKAKLGDPHGLVEHLVRLEEVVQEYSGGDAVDVKIHKVGGAPSTAGAEPALQPAETHAAAAVGDRGRSDASLALEGVHVLLVRSRRRLGRHVGLLGMVRLVEAEQGLGAGGNHLLGVGLPRVGEALGRSPHHGNVLEPGLGVVRLRPVVRPADLGVGAQEAGEQAGVVVGQAAAAGSGGGRAATAGGAAAAGGGAASGGHGNVGVDGDDRRRRDSGGGRLDGRGGGGHNGGGGHCRGGAGADAGRVEDLVCGDGLGGRRGANLGRAAAGAAEFERGSGSGCGTVGSDGDPVGDSDDLGHDPPLDVHVGMARAGGGDVLEEGGGHQGDESLGKHFACVYVRFVGCM